MKINPLAVFTGLTLATFAALVYVERNTGAEIAPMATAKVEPLPVPAAPKPAEPAKVEPAPVTEIAKVEEPPKVEEPKPAEPAAPAATAKVEAPAPAPAAPAEKTKIVPTFDTVRVEPSGDALIAGRAEPGSEVVVKFNGMTVGTAMANADGAFVVTPDKPLPTGPGALSIESKSKEIVVASADSVAVDVKVGAADTPLVAVLKPDEPTKVIQAPAAQKPVLPPSESVNVDSVDYDQSGNIVFSGRGPAGSKVQVYVDNKAYGLTEINDKGTWTLPGLSALTVGPHALRADEIGGDGAVKSRQEMPFYREEPSKLPSAAPAAAPEQQVAAAEPAPAKPVEAAKVEAVPAAAAPDTAEVVKAPELVPEETPAVVAAQVPAATEPAAAPAAPTQVIIQPGNNLWKLSRQIYGKGIMYTVIFEANKDQIRKPELIYPGQVFMTPDAPAATTGQ
jgi:nucleoid-associated protein YgaU